MTIDALKRRISGAVVTAIEPGFGAEHDALIWNGRKPAPRARLIVRAASAADVQEAVGFAAAHGLTVSPRGGGHHLTGIAARADMVIDLGALKGLQIDTAAPAHGSSRRSPTSRWRPPWTRRGWPFRSAIAAACR